MPSGEGEHVWLDVEKNGANTAFVGYPVALPLIGPEASVAMALTLLVLLGLLLVGGSRVAPALGLALTGTAGLLHGSAHGLEMAGAGSFGVLLFSMMSWTCRVLCQRNVMPAPGAHSRPAPKKFCDPFRSR